MSMLLSDDFISPLPVEVNPFQHMTIRVICGVSCADIYYCDLQGFMLHWEMSSAGCYLCRRGEVVFLNNVYVCFCGQANAIGRSAKTVREFLEKHYAEDQVATERGTIKLALKALLEVVQSGSRNMEVAVMRRREPLRVSKHSPASLVRHNT